MDLKKFIIRLIVQDLRHHQLVLGLSRLELESDGYYELEISRMVAELMNIKPGDIPDDWAAVYDAHMEQSITVPLERTSTRLYRLAENCYLKLMDVR